MSEIKVQEKEVVTPGEVLAEGIDFIPSQGTYRQGDNLMACRLGLVSIEGKVLKIIPLSGKYLPKRNDVIIGKIVEILISGWRMETNCAYPAMLSMKEATSEYIARGADLSKFFDIDDYIVTKIVNVTSQKLVDVTMRGPGLRKLVGGRVIMVNTNKVPRIIGKQGTMISMVKQTTNCRIIVGQNGLIWVSGDDPKNELIAVQVIKKIEEESHLTGLTERIKHLLEEKTGNKVTETKGDQNQLQET
ncbi:MAG: exosome complex RNA-binding protein Rrp4 [Candidatus Woesearchaeota archaeon]